MSEPATTPSDLFASALSGNVSAEGEIMKIVRRCARAVCRQGGEADWEDLAQESCTRLLTTGIRRFKGDCSEGRYIYIIVRTTWIQMLRGLRRRRLREEAVAITGVVGMNADARIDVHRILSRMAEGCRELLERAFLSDVSYADLSIQMGIAESSVRSKVTRCLQRARKLVGSEV